MFKFFYILLNTLLIFCISAKPNFNRKCKGSIRGYVVGFSAQEEGYVDLPSGLSINVTAIDTLKKKKFTTISGSTDLPMKSNVFSIIIPPGVYYIYAEVSFRDESHHKFDVKGYYTRYTKEAMYLAQNKDTLNSHKPIPIKVECNEIITDIHPGDIWTK